MTPWISPDLYDVCRAELNFEPPASLEQFLLSFGLAKIASEGPQLNKNQINILALLFLHKGLKRDRIANAVWSAGEGEYSQPAFDQKVFNTDFDQLLSWGLVSVGNGGLYKPVIKQTSNQLLPLTGYDSEESDPEEKNTVEPVQTENSNKRQKTETDNTGKLPNVEPVTFNSDQIMAELKHVKKSVKSSVRKCTYAVDDLIDVDDRRLREISSKLDLMLNKIDLLFSNGNNSNAEAKPGVQLGSSMPNGDHQNGLEPPKNQ